MQVCSLIPRPFIRYEASRCVDQPILEMSLMFPYSSSKNSMSTYSTPEFFLMLCTVRGKETVTLSLCCILIVLGGVALSIFVTMECLWCKQCCSSLIPRPAQLSVGTGNETSTALWGGKGDVCSVVAKV